MARGWLFGGYRPCPTSSGRDCVNTARMKAKVLNEAPAYLRKSCDRDTGLALIDIGC